MQSALNDCHALQTIYIKVRIYWRYIFLIKSSTAPMCVFEFVYKTGEGIKRKLFSL